MGVPLDIFCNFSMSMKRFQNKKLEKCMHMIKL